MKWSDDVAWVVMIVVCGKDGHAARIAAADGISSHR
jgi:hypothetical protein